MAPCLHGTVLSFNLFVPFCCLPGKSRAITLLSTYQGKNELSDYVQEFRTFISAIQSDLLPDVAHVKVFMEGLRPGRASTLVFRVHPTTSKGAVEIVHNADYSLKLANLGGNEYNPSSTKASSMSTSSSSRPEPTDISNAEGDSEDESNLQVAKQPRVIRRCYKYGSTKHLRPGCPLRKLRQAHMSRNSANIQKARKARKNDSSQ